jgi:hypothetical protein
VPVTVAGQDVRDLLLITTPAGSISGRLALDGAASAPGPNAFFVTAAGMGPDSMSARQGAATVARPSADGVFVLDGIRGRYVVRLRQGPPGWWLDSVTIGGVDVTDSGFDVAGGEAVAIEVVATQRMSSLSGTVKDAADKPVSDYSVVAFSPDDAKWGPHTRFVVAAAPAADGTFTVAGLVPGEYVVAAVPPIEAGDETDPERLARWRTIGARVSLGDAESRSMTLTMGR